MLLALLACAADPPVTPWRDADPVVTERVPDGASPPALVLNEVMGDNASVVMTSTLDFADWVEIYNAADVPVDLARAGLSEDGSAGWVGSGVLSPGERRLLWATGGTAPDELPFALDADGDALVLTWDGVPIDRIRTGPLAEDTAWARFPDGGAWALTGAPTPGGPNGAAPGDPDPSAAIFDPTVVHALDLVLSEASLASLAASPYTQVEGGLGFRGAWFPAVGVSIKGVWGSLRSPDGKMALKIDLDDYGPYGLAGLEHLTLNNMVQDPSAIHEAVTYAWLRERGIPAPRTGWVRLSLNGEDRGFYLLIEAPDEHFLARWFDDAGGQLWEGAYGVDFTSDLEDFQYDSGPDVPDYTKLATIAAILDEEATDTAVAALEAHVHLDQWIDVFAFEAVALHWDGYSTANNYRIYEDPVSGRVAMLPWGLDQTWVDAYLGPYDGRGRVYTFCLENAGCRARYDAALVAWADAVEADDLVGDIEALLPLVRAELATDPYFEWDMDTHAAWVEATRATMWEWPAEVRAAAEADRAGL